MAGRSFMPFPERTSSTKKIGTNWWERVVVQRSAYAVDAIVEDLTERSKFLRETMPPGNVASFAVVNRDEVRKGKLLGQGSYNEVHEVLQLELNDSEDEGDDDDIIFDPEGEEINVSSTARDARQILKEKVNELGRNGGKYAIKHLKPDLVKNAKTFETAAADLIMEAKFLSKLDHPNILKMRGIAMGGTAAYACTGLYDNFFIIIDKIHETLNERLAEWRIQSTSHLCNPRNNTLLLKMDIALQIGSALTYLHDRRLVYRDLKPHNVGLTSSGTVQLFDFGFCRELPDLDLGRCYTGLSSQESFDEEENRLYGMSGKGTLMYMSPEVLGTRRYNTKADVCSWSFLLYEMLTLRRPFSIESVDAHRRAVYRRGERPLLQGSGIPRSLTDLLENCWDGSLASRYNMREAVCHLEYVLSHMPSPNLRAQVGSLETCLVSASKVLWNPVQGLWNTLLSDAHFGHLKLEGKPDQADQDTEPGSQLITTKSSDGSKRIVANPTAPTRSISTDFDAVSSSNHGSLSFGLPTIVQDSELQPEVEIVIGNLPETADADKGSRDEDFAVPQAQRNDNTSDRKGPPRSSKHRKRTSHRQAPRGQRGTLLYHSYYGRVPGKKMQTKGDGVYKDRLLRTIYSVQGIEPRTPITTPKKQVVSPSA